MRWLYKVSRWLPPTRSDVLGAIFVTLVIAGVLISYLRWPFAGRALWSLNSGPGWTCTYPGKGEPVCVKDVPRATVSP